MNNKKSLLPDQDMQSSLPALIRAAKHARELAARTQTEFIVIRDGKLVREIPPLDELQDDHNKAQENT